MRQFVFGLLVAVLAIWGYGTWRGGGAAAAGPEAPGSAPTAQTAGNPAAGNAAAGPDLEAMLAPAGGSSRTPAPATPSASVPLDLGAAPAGVDVDDLLRRLAGKDAGAADVAWLVVTSRAPAADRQRLLDALLPDGELEAQWARLGTFNTFLHSAEGRAKAGKVLAQILALPDAAAVAAGSRLLLQCLRGRIERGDTEARAFVDEAYRQHRVRADRWLCDPTNVTSARTYTVAAGDSLARIAARFRREKVMVEEGTLALLNRIHNPNAVQVGQKLKVPVEPVSALVQKRSFGMVVLVGSHVLRLYWIGHGENDKTPVTEFTVVEKQPKPEWTAPDGMRYPYGHPKNILGEYFVKFQHDQYTGFGAHGTPMPETIGTMSSMGCIRMLGPDIQELFKILPRGAKVVIQDVAPGRP
jgi:nucleoid-associated protein YgaU